MGKGVRVSRFSTEEKRGYDFVRPATGWSYKMPQDQVETGEKSMLDFYALSREEGEIDTVKRSKTPQNGPTAPSIRHFHTVSAELIW